MPYADYEVKKQKERERYRSSREKRKEQARRYYVENRDKVLEYKKKHYEFNREEYWDRNKEWRKKNKVRRAEWNRQERDKLRGEVIDAHGGECVCCGENRLAFLSLDHIHDDGNDHRKTVDSWTLYRQLRREGPRPDSIQVLCRNCNWAKFTCGVCPHQTEEIIDE